MKKIVLGVSVLFFGLAGFGEGLRGQVLGDATCPACGLQMRSVTSLGDSVGIGMLESDYHFVTADSQGRYIVTGGTPYFWVFDSSGEALAKIGRRGEGPGEFSSAESAVVGPRDSIYVFDSSLSRISVYDSELTLARVATLEHGVSGKAWFFQQDVIVANAGIHSADRIGLPLHVVRPDGSLGISFGSDAAGIYRGDMREIIDIRPIAPSGDSAVWAVRLNQYHLEEWSLEGHLIRSLERTPDWFATWWTLESDAETRPVPVTESIASQGGDLLWLHFKVPGPRWRSAVEPDGRMYRVIDQEAYRVSRIDIVNVKQGSVFVSATLPHNIDGLLENGRYYRTTTDVVGNPIIEIGRVAVIQP